MLYVNSVNSEDEYIKFIDVVWIGLVMYLITQSVFYILPQYSSIMIDH